MASIRQAPPKTETPHFATLLLMALAPQEVGRRITAARKAKGWTHEELARRMSVNWRTVQRWQKGVDARGKSTLPRLGTLMDLADLFELPRSHFVETELPEGAAAFAEFAERLASVEKTQARNQELLDELLQLARDQRDGETPQESPG